MFHSLACMPQLTSELAPGCTATDALWGVLMVWAGWTLLLARWCTVSTRKWDGAVDVEDTVTLVIGLMLIAAVATLVTLIVAPAIVAAPWQALLVTVVILVAALMIHYDKWIHGVGKRLSITAALERRRRKVEADLAATEQRLLEARRQLEADPYGRAAYAEVERICDAR